MQGAVNPSMSGARCWPADLSIRRSVEDVQLHETAGVEPFLLPVDILKDVEPQPVRACRPVLVEEKLRLLIVVEVLLVVVAGQFGEVGLQRFLHVRHVHRLPLREAVEDQRVAAQFVVSVHCG